MNTLEIRGKMREIEQEVLWRKQNHLVSSDKAELFAFIFMEKLDCAGYSNKLILTKCLECRLE